MGRFYPLYVRRSDGRSEIACKGARKKEANQPTDEQLDQKPDRNGISDYYRQVAPDEPKHLDWRRKIGGMLARELNSNHQPGDNGYILATFPENYRLYEHVKKTVVDGKTEVKSKTHGAGGNDRQDAYLYGHPLGRRKRFRSPGDFFAHVLWLATDESGDPDNCTCKICSPEDLENLIPGANVQSKKLPGIPPTTTSASASTSASRPASSSGVKAKADAIPTTTTTPTPTTTNPTTTTKSRPSGPTPLPKHNLADQFYDSQYRSFQYRPGEMIWFQRGQAWALGIITRRWGQPQPQNTNDHNYLVQPLSHPPLPSKPNYPQTIIKTSELEMRPWIAWSVPRFTNEGLNNLSPPPQYESTDWQALKDGRFGTGDLEVDASILAAKMIDLSYTPSIPTLNTTPHPGITETHYTALFLGAEKLWIGDPIRLHVGNGTDIMVLHSIIERRNNNSPSTPPEIQILGDIYTLTTVPHSDPQITSPAAPQANPHLPSRLTDDLAYRNARSIRLRHIANYWQLIHPARRIGLNDIKGRWYEASLILPILQAGPFAEAERKGDIHEAGLFMNSRGDSAGPQQRAGRINVRRERREEAFGRSVPMGLEVLDGFHPLVEDQGVKVEEDVGIDPRFETADDDGNGNGGNGGGDEGKGGFDEFMNLDGGESGLGGGYEEGFGVAGHNPTGGFFH
ncbi:uncharacterized protein RCC_10050 [Ramularia collo-cygni]|uniref:Cryptic loci regulator 2 N-terminal domain-containing protein n=1 Tax=Ramularia collo-cygni TaxID=112498 RepID=A0A2D3V1Y6_9PEZI|nr:uncharacterized protein RCC_10050 [Ramularia collo-cygni]CZT24327.1 uncharacterized protein RCC_10050 [Ramularia collo-cygni]